MDKLDDFKILEEKHERILTPEKLYIFRLDGANFRRLTKQFDKPFSFDFVDCMSLAAQTVSLVIPNYLLIYGASDEISIVASGARQAPYGGRLNKLLPILSSHATAGFLSGMGDKIGIPAFDARVIEVDSPGDILDYISWRRLNTRKNAISMAVESLHSPGELENVSLADRAFLLQGTHLETLDETIFNGFFLRGEKIVPATRKEAEIICEEAAARHKLYQETKKQ